ncbi:MAG TPA: GNAT family N-acetyltransferase [Dokdonella sp.]|uniref:GNAT family N-acetyltransferase n=1 Tax=Dokdonella sp. TaxID=2291710 RepID=UPI002D7F42D5|nr:GNAT family N-acetyltransferase [Dokdonella sp.]HET9032836.1 GNAT family N-acetyltransferase [Dokdonella sp.]
MQPIVVRSLAPALIEPAARLLAGSMRDNPLHQRVFSGHVAHIEPLLAVAFTRLLQRQMRTGLVLGAFDEDALVGVAAMVPPGQCQPTLREKLAMLAILVRGGMLRHLPGIQRWLWLWAREDPDLDHWHLGPAAVERRLQGQGIGTALMAVMCDALDQRQAIGYLETDKDANVRLYRRGGFEVIAERQVLGVPNWFMLRPRNTAYKRQEPAQCTN